MSETKRAAVLGEEGADQGKFRSKVLSLEAGEGAGGGP